VAAAGQGHLVSQQARAPVVEGHLGRRRPDPRQCRHARELFSTPPSPYSTRAAPVKEPHINPRP